MSCLDVTQLQEIQDLSGFSTRLMKDLNRGSVILKLELALFAADANRPMKVKALPYWDQSLDSEDPVGRSGFPRGPWARTISPTMLLVFLRWRGKL